MENIRTSLKVDSSVNFADLKLQALKLLKQGYIQSEVANKLGVSQTTVSKWYRNYAESFYRNVINTTR